MQTEKPDQNSDTDSHIADDVMPAAEESIQSPSLGEVLQTERLRLNLSEKDVSEQLHITMHYVRAIESNRFDKLPGAVFAKGYIKNYALLLGIDPSTVTVLFDGINSEQQEMKDEATRRHLARRRSDRNKPWVYASVAGIVLFFGGLWAYNVYSNSQAEHQVAPKTQPMSPATIASRPIAQTPAPTVSAAISVPLPAATPSPGTNDLQPAQVQPVTTLSAASDSQLPLAPAPLLTPPATGATDSAPATALPVAAATDSAPAEIADPLGASDADRVFVVGAEGDDVLRINFSGESWVEVNDSQSRQIYRDIRAAGDVLEITGDAPFNILLGDAPFTQMFLNGNEINVSDNIRIDNSARLTVGL